MATTRSPNYPFIPLDQAIERARVLWTQENRHPAAPETVVKHWGYGPKSSGGKQTIAALRHFGLLEGRGQVQLTELAQAILFSEVGSSQWLAKVREAAVQPTIHREILAKYAGKLPSDSNMTYHLVVERHFAESGAADLIKELRATLDFARYTPEAAANLSENEEDNSEDADEVEETLDQLDQQDPKGGSGSRARRVMLPYSATSWAALEASFPLTGQEWDQMLAVLTAMKPALTENAPAAHDITHGTIGPKRS